MACTATATLSVKQEVIDVLEMAGCVEVCVSPNRHYEVKLRADIASAFFTLVRTLRNEAINTPRVLIYCQTVDMCVELYAHFRDELRDASYYPRGSPELCEHRLYGMFHAGTPQHNKEVILKYLLTPNGVVRVLFATVALGMGIDLKDVNWVIHYGSPHSLEDYFQESGRGGRSGADAISTVYWKPADCPKIKDPTTIRDQEVIAVRCYLENLMVCRRRWLQGYFDIRHNEPHPASHCCDVCSKKITLNNSS